MKKFSYAWSSSECPWKQKLPNFRIILLKEETKVLHIISYLKNTVLPFVSRFKHLLLSLAKITDFSFKIWIWWKCFLLAFCFGFLGVFLAMHYRYNCMSSTHIYIFNLTIFLITEWPALLDPHCPLKKGQYFRSKINLPLPIRVPIMHK